MGYAWALLDANKFLIKIHTPICKSHFCLIFNKSHKVGCFVSCPSSSYVTKYLLPIYLVIKFLSTVLIPENDLS